MDSIVTATFEGEVTVVHAPISERMWKAGDTATIHGGQIRLGGCWFDFDERYIVKLVTS